MKKNVRIIYFSILLLGILDLMLAFFIKKNTYNLENTVIIAGLSAIIIILISNFGLKRDKRYLKTTTTMTVITDLMLYGIIIYLLGIVLGFNRSYFVLDILTFSKNIIPVILITVLLEMLRYLVVSNCYKNIKVIFMFTVLSSILLVIYDANIGRITTEEDKFIFLSTIVFPIIAQEAICGYMSYKIACLPSFIYKLVLNIYIYIIPIVPNLGNYIYSVANIILPFLIYISLNKTVIKYEREKQSLKSANKYIFAIPLVLCLIVLVILVSGVFGYRMIAVASNSMKPKYARGDAVIYDKVNYQDLKIGDILAFNKEGTIITHRIIKIWKRGNDYYYTTKGDNNSGVDLFNPTNDNVLGVVKYRIKYIGYPTVLISEYFRKE